MKIELDGLSKRFGSKRVLDGLNEVFAPGRIVAVLGLNGAGKSTLLHCLAGILAPNDGRILFDGNGLRFLLALPCWLTAAGMGAWLLHISPGLAFGILLKIWLLALLAQPLLLAFNYSRGTNTSSQLLMSVLLFLLLAFLCLVVFVAFIYALMTTFNDDLVRWSAPALALFAVVSFGFEALYRRLYLRRFDLLAKLPPTTSPYPVG